MKGGRWNLYVKVGRDVTVKKAYLGEDVTKAKIIITHSFARCRTKGIHRVAAFIRGGAISVPCGDSLLCDCETHEAVGL